MKNWMLALTLLFQSCGLWKEKNRVKAVSLFQQKSETGWQFNREVKSTINDAKQGFQVAEVLIHADAPFNWQVDSGLSGKAGTYQVFMIQKDQTSSQQTFVNKEKASGISKEKSTELQKLSEERKSVSRLSPPKGVILGIAVIGFIWIVWRLKKVYSQKFICLLSISMNLN